MINILAIGVGAVLVLVGLVNITIERADNRDARAVRAFFRGYADSHQVSYIGPKGDGEWEIHVRSLDNRGEPYTAVPTRLLLQLSDETQQTTPWTKIVVDPPSGQAAPAGDTQ